MTILDSIVNTSLALTIYSKNTLEVLSQLLTSNSTTRHHARPHLHLISTFPSHSSPSITTIAASLGSNVSIKHSIYREAYSEPASSYIIRSRASGSRTIVNYNELPEMTAKEFVDTVSRLRAGSEGPAGDEAQAPSSVEGSDTDYWFHFEGRIPDVTLRCVRYLRKAIPRVKISLEVEKPNREGLEDLAGEADVVFYSRSWAAAKGYGDAESCVRGQAERTKA
jgi:ketohexokinase